jgi:hypothetical protein
VAKRALSLVRAYNIVVQEPKLIVVQSFGTRLEAELAKGALIEAGIDAMIQSDTVGGMREHLAWSGAGFRILVREDDAAAAHEVLTSPPQGDESPDSDSPIDDDSYPPWRKFS